MKLAPHHLAWLFEVEALARRNLWTPYVQSLKNHRQFEPSLILVRRAEVLAVWTRTSKPDRGARIPDLDQLANRGIEGILAVEDEPESRKALRDRLERPPSTVTPTRGSSTPHGDS